MKYCFLCDECGERHVHACAKATHEKLIEARHLLEEAQVAIKSAQAYIGELEDALATTFGEVAELFGAMSEEVKAVLPERYSFFHECIAALKSVQASHEQKRGNTNATTN